MLSEYIESYGQGSSYGQPKHEISHYGQVGTRNTFAILNIEKEGQVLLSPNYTPVLTIEE